MRHPAAALRIAQKIPFSVEKGIFFLFREVFLNQLTRILNAARAGAPYIAVSYTLEVAAQIRAVLLLELLLEHFRDLIGLTLGRARLIRSCAVFMPASMNAPLSAPHISIQPMPKPKPSDIL